MSFFSQPLTESVTHRELDTFYQGLQLNFDPIFVKFTRETTPAAHHKTSWRHNASKSPPIDWAGLSDVTARGNPNHLSKTPEDKNAALKTSEDYTTTTTTAPPQPTPHLRSGRSFDVRSLPPASPRPQARRVIKAPQRILRLVPAVRWCGEGARGSRLRCPQRGDAKGGTRSRRDTPPLSNQSREGGPPAPSWARGGAQTSESIQRRRVNSYALACQARGSAPSALPGDSIQRSRERLARSHWASFNPLTPNSVLVWLQQHLFGPSLSFSLRLNNLLHRRMFANLSTDLCS